MVWFEGSTPSLTAKFKFKDVLGRLFSYLYFIKINNLSSYIVWWHPTASEIFSNAKSNAKEIW